MDEVETIIEMAEELRPLTLRRLAILNSKFPHIWKRVFTYVCSLNPQALIEGFGPFTKEERADITLLYIEGMSLLVPKEISDKIEIEISLEGANGGVYNGRDYWY